MLLDLREILYVILHHIYLTAVVIIQISQDNFINKLSDQPLKYDDFFF